VGAHHKGTHEGCPYETGLVAAEGRSEQPGRASTLGWRGLAIDGHIHQLEAFDIFDDVGVGDLLETATHQPDVLDRSFLESPQVQCAFRPLAIHLFNSASRVARLNSLAEGFGAIRRVVADGSELRDDEFALRELRRPDAFQNLRQSVPRVAPASRKLQEWPRRSVNRFRQSGQSGSQCDSCK